MPNALNITGGSAGLQLAARFRNNVDDLMLNKASAGQGLMIAPLSSYYLPDTPPDHRESGMLLGYGTISTSAIEDAVIRLKRILEELPEV